MTVPILDVFIESQTQLSTKMPAVIQGHKCPRTHVISRQHRRGLFSRYLLSLFIYGLIVALLVRKRFTQ
jgi:hypothetical protein